MKRCDYLKVVNPIKTFLNLFLLSTTQDTVKLNKPIQAINKNKESKCSYESLKNLAKYFKNV